MDTQIVPVVQHVQTYRTPDADDVARHFFSGKNPNTLRAYTQSLAHFAAYLKVETPTDALRELFSLPAGSANALVLGYVNAMVEEGGASATVQSRLSAIKAANKLARMLGVVPWSIEISAPKAENYRDTRGCGHDGFQAIMGNITGSDPKSCRDRAMIRLMFDMALRRETVANIDIADVELSRGRLWTLPKGKTSKLVRTLPAQTKEAISLWLEVHPGNCEALFVNLDRAYETRRI